MIQIHLYHDTCSAGGDAHGEQVDFPELVRDPDYFIDGLVGYKCPKCDLVIGVEVVLDK